MVSRHEVTRQASQLLSWQMWRDDLMKTDLQLIEVHRREATCPESCIAVMGLVEHRTS